MVVHKVAFISLRDADARQVLVMDEPTSNIDPETDQAVQAVCNGQGLQHVTTLTVAHRLLTIANCRRVMVMDAGRVAECDTPQELLRREGGAFRAMANALGPTASAAVEAKAAGPPRGT